MKRLLGIVWIGLCLLGPRWAFANQLQWQVPNFGTVNLDLTTTEALIGYDGINKVALAGASLPVYTDPKGILALELGAVAPWQTNEIGVQPFVGIGHDFAKEIPILAQFQTLHLDAFGRWDSANGKAGAGLAVSYSFGGVVPVQSPAVPPPSLPAPTQ
jgi:hypothetical protein